MHQLFIFLVIIGVVNCSDNSMSRNKRSIYVTPVRSTAEMAISNGYEAESHYVTTENGYILNLHRIPRGKAESANSSITKPKAFLMHCTYCSSNDWVMNEPEDALGFFLADNGYDVWMGNGRGNIYSRNHTYLNLNSKKFWDFSFHELSVIDLPTSIDYVLQVTGTTQVHYAAYNIGNLLFNVMLSEKPECNSKDSLRLARNLPNVVLVKQVDHPKFSHFDFLWAKNVKQYINDDLLKLFSNYRDLRNKIIFYLS